jgi:hypothetical protein
LNGYQQKRAIPAANPCLGIWCGHQCDGFFLGKELDRSFLEAFGGNSENALALHAERRFSERNVSEEGMESRETVVSRAGPIASIVFQVFEKRFHELRIEFLETQSARGATKTVFGKLQQETEGVAIARHSVGTCTLLGYQTLGKEPLEESRKSGDDHWSPPGR